MPRFLKILIIISLIILFSGFGFLESKNIVFAQKDGNVYVCPHATSLDKVYYGCPGMIILRLGETINGMTLTITEYEGKEYYTILGFENGGAGVLEEARLETQIVITQMEYDKEDILERVTQDIADHQPPLLLSELKNYSLNLGKYLPPEKKRISPNQKKKLKMKFKFLETAGNEYQGTSINVKFKFIATQEEK